MTININEDTTVREISVQLADIIDNPQFLGMSDNTQNCIIGMFDAVNKILFSKGE